MVRKYLEIGDSEFLKIPIGHRDGQYEEQKEGRVKALEKALKNVKVDRFVGVIIIRQLLENKDTLVGVHSYNADTKTLLCTAYEYLVDLVERMPEPTSKMLISVFSKHPEIMDALHRSAFPKERDVGVG